jgi:hypothetical protein
LSDHWKNASVEIGNTAMKACYRILICAPKSN